MNSEFLTRQSIRLRGFDYSYPNNFFITICTQDRAHLLGKVVGDRSFLSPFGRVVDTYIKSINTHYQTINVPEYILMPNHVHFIIELGRTRGSAPTLGNIVKKLKTFTTHEYLEGIRVYGWPPFNGRLWQRNYYEHIIRDGSDMGRIIKYILNNPANWTKDKLFS